MQSKVNEVTRFNQQGIRNLSLQYLHISTSTSLTDRNYVNFEHCKVMASGGYRHDRQYQGTGQKASSKLSQSGLIAEFIQSKPQQTISLQSQTKLL